MRVRNDELLLGEWACLGLLALAPAHGYDLAARLAPSGDVGRVYTLGRPLTYRALEQLAARGLIEVVREEPGRAGGTRTFYGLTRSGRALLRTWLGQPVAHVREVRTELLLKLVLNDLLGNDTTALIVAQRSAFEPFAVALTRSVGPEDVVELWREEASRAALHFLERLAHRPSGTGSGGGSRERTGP